MDLQGAIEAFKAQHPDEAARIQAEGTQIELEQVKAEAAEAERERVKAILGLLEYAPHCKDLVYSLAFVECASADDAAVKVLKAGAY